MKFTRSIFGKWEKHHQEFFSKEGIHIDLGYSRVFLEERPIYFKLLPLINSAPEFSDKRIRVSFEKEELELGRYYMLHGSASNIVDPQNFSDEDDGYDYLRFAFGELCKSCNHTPKGEQVNPFVFSKEPKLPNKSLWGSVHGVSGYLFTNKATYQLLKKSWGLEKVDVLIGKNKKVSNNFVQIKIPVSKTRLKFGNSDFGKTFKLDGSGEIIDDCIYCSECNRPLYTNKLLDFFPSFDQQMEFDIVFTQEWFGWYRRLVVSKAFVEWMIAHKYIKFTSQYLIPVKEFNNLQC